MSSTIKRGSIIKFHSEYGSNPIIIAQVISKKKNGWLKARCIEPAYFLDAVFSVRNIHGVILQINNEKKQEKKQEEEEEEDLVLESNEEEYLGPNNDDDDLVLESNEDPVCKFDLAHRKWVLETLKDKMTIARNEALDNIWKNMDFYEQARWGDWNRWIAFLGTGM